MQNVYILSAVRTPIGSFGGVFASLTAVDLGARAIEGALDRAGISADQVQEVYMGNVVQANLGQAPARQAALKAGLSESVPCTTINKVCSSGMKSIMLAAQSIQLEQLDIAVAGGMESMSNIPHYAPSLRWGNKYGDATLVDGLAKDGLTDAYNHVAMGVAADETAVESGISRQEQDEYAISSYERSAASTAAGDFSSEIIEVHVPQRRGDDLIVSEDEEYKKVKFEKIPTLRAAFTKDGTVTAANASTINDGAAALILIGENKMKELGLKPIAKILSYADAAHAPMRFTTAPTVAAPLAISRAGLTQDDIDYYEVNEAFSVVTLAFNKKLGIDREKVNVHGGAVSLGHPLGASGARIVCTLAGVLRQKEGEIGLATLCNGGGGASAIIIERC